MRTLTAPLLLLASFVLSSTSYAQFESARPLIAKADSSPVAGIPLDGMWSSQYFIGEGDSYITAVDGGYLDVVEHHHVRWDAEQRAYRGINGRTMRVQSLGDSRLLMEYDLLASHGTWVNLVRWDGREMHFFKFDRDENSDFTRHLRSHGVNVIEEVVSGNPQTIQSALRSLPLAERGHDSRLRRPKHSEMGEIWNYFEIVRWVEQQTDVLAQITEAESSLQRLGDLHKAHYFANQASSSKLANLHGLALEPFAYGRMGGSHFQRLYQQSESIQERLIATLERRMEWGGTQVSIVEYIEHVDDPDNPWDFVSHPNPGALLKFHMVITDAEGNELENTRAKDEPIIAPIMGDLPEGIQWALRTMGYDEKITVSIPPQLAFGSQFGVVQVELEIVEGIPNFRPHPPLRDELGYYIATVDAEETASGLRFRDLVVGEGDPPKRGEQVRIQTLSWNAVGHPLSEPQTITTTVGADDMFPGVTEGLLSMSPGGQRVLFIPHHLADTGREFSGTSQCVVIELLPLTD